MARCHHLAVSGSAPASISASNVWLNSRMTPKQLRQYCPLDAECQRLMRSAMDELGLSARAHDRILRMARTIADLAGEPHLRPEHLSEAIGYRSLYRRLWAR